MCLSLSFPICKYRKANLGRLGDLVLKRITIKAGRSPFTCHCVFARGPIHSFVWDSNGNHAARQRNALPCAAESFRTSESAAVKETLFPVITLYITRVRRSRGDASQPLCFLPAGPACTGPVSGTMPKWCPACWRLALTSTSSLLRESWRQS